MFTIFLSRFFFYFTLLIPCLLAFSSLFVLYLLPFVSFRFILICFLTEPEMEFLKQITVIGYLGPRETLLRLRELQLPLSRKRKKPPTALVSKSCCNHAVNFCKF